MNALGKKQKNVNKKSQKMLLKTVLHLRLISNFTPLKKHNFLFDENRRFCLKTHRSA